MLYLTDEKGNRWVTINRWGKLILHLQSQPCYPARNQVNNSRCLKMHYAYYSRLKT